MNFNKDKFLEELIKDGFVRVCNVCHLNLIYNDLIIPEEMDHSLRILYEKVLHEKCDVGAGFMRMDGELVCHDCHPLASIQLEDVLTGNDRNWGHMMAQVHTKFGWEHDSTIEDRMIAEREAENKTEDEIIGIQKEGDAND